MGFWQSCWAYGLALLSQSPFTQHPTSIHNLLPGFHDPSPPESTSTPFPNTKPVHNAYNSPFSTSNDCNTADNRRQWCQNTDITTDYDDIKLVPNTGVVRQFTLVLTSGDVFCGDGYCANTTLINGTYPGPLLRGNWGDMFEITVINNLSNCNGTSIHWHGIRQWNTVWEDGVAGVTQCPIAPGKTQTYKWRATQYGTSWYHSHFSLQYANGLAGPLIIDGPSSANYDVDMGPIMLTDWYHADAFGLYHNELAASPNDTFLFPPSDLINGQGNFVKVYKPNNTESPVVKEPGCKRFGPDGTIIDKDCVLDQGSSYRTNIEPSKGTKKTVYKFRVVNMSTTKHYTFWIDRHKLTVIANDFVPIAPVTVDYINVGIGQRYDFLVEARSAEDLKKEELGPNFWIRTRLCSSTCYDESACARTGDGSNCRWEECRKAILSYDATSTADPDDNREGMAGKIPISQCNEMDHKIVKPIVQRNLAKDGIKPKIKFAHNDYFEVVRGPGTQNVSDLREDDENHANSLPLDPNDELKSRETSLDEAPKDDKNLTHIWSLSSNHNAALDPNNDTYTSFMIDWSNATLGLAAKGIPSREWHPRFFPVVLNPNPSNWTIFAIAASWTQEDNHNVSALAAVPGAAHPIHVHGHDFVVLNTDHTVFDDTKEYKLHLENPPRRDVVLLPAFGWVIIGFKLDNPGTWLMHCHIAWHASSGLALQWVELPEEIPKVMEGQTGQFEDRCEEWRKFEDENCKYDGVKVFQDDSGI